MALYLPGPGYVGSMLKTVLVGLDYMVIGPVGAGLWVRDVHVVATANADGHLGFGVAIGGIGQASAVCYNAARPLVHVSAERIGDHPAIHFGTVTEGSVGHWLLPVGRRACTGSQYVIVVLSLAGIGNEATLVVSVRTLQILREADLSG